MHIPDAIFCVTLSLLLNLDSVECLRFQPENYAEGSCNYVRWWAAGGPFNESLYEWAETLRYVPAASKYHYYRLASVFPASKRLTDKDLQNQLCCMKKAHLSHGVGHNRIFGFGNLLRDFDTESGEVSSGSRYLLNIPRPSNDKTDTFRETITHTDGLTFAFMVGCWENSDDKVWKVLSLRPELTSNVKREIIAHAKQLNFRPEHFMFIKYDKCNLDQYSQQQNKIFQNHKDSILENDAATSVVTVLRPRKRRVGWAAIRARREKLKSRNQWNHPELSTTTYTPFRKLQRPALIYEHSPNWRQYEKRWLKKSRSRKDRYI